MYLEYPGYHGIYGGLGLAAFYTIHQVICQDTGNIGVYLPFPDSQHRVIRNRKVWQMGGGVEAKMFTVLKTWIFYESIIVFNNVLGFTHKGKEKKMKKI